MKNIIVLVFALVATIAAHAQSQLRTDVSVRSQYVNNSVPGAVYRDASVKANKQPAAVQQKSTSALLKGNEMPGMRYKTSNSGGGTSAKQPATNSGAQMASDKKAEKQPAVKMPEAPQLTQ